LNWSTHAFNDLNVNSLPDGNEICVCIVVVEVGIKSLSYLNLNPLKIPQGIHILMRIYMITH
jgi:hypothetical protein